MAGLDFGASSGAARFSRSRGRIGNQANRGINYPSPFFDIGHTYLPTTVKQMFRWCRYYFLVHPLINSVVFKMSQYPITDLVYHTEQEEQKDKWRDFLENGLKYRAFMEEIGLDYHTYGNGMVSLFFPFKKILTCPECGDSLNARDATYYFRNFQFYRTCLKCQHHGPQKVKDRYIKSSKGIRLLRWNPEDIDVRYNDLNGEYTYFYEIPVQLKNDIIMGKRHVVEEVPQIFIDALKKRRAIVFSKDNIFHFRRPTIAGKDRGWGTPLLLPVLKDAFYLQILKKSQEAIALEHIVPLRILFPQAGSATADPYTSVNLGDWKDQIQEEIARWRFDNNYMPILPLPVGNQTIGGDGRSLLVGQEIRMWSEQIVTGMGVPTELIFGGLSYSGSNVSLRMLENIFLGYMIGHLGMLKWVIKSVSAYMDWDTIDVRFKPFKMADDLQRKAYNFQLNGAGKISDASLLSDADYDPKNEEEQINKERVRASEAMKKDQLAQADIQGESQVIMARWQLKAQQEQMKAQQAMGPAPGEPGAEAMGVQEGGGPPQMAPQGAPQEQPMPPMNGGMPDAMAPVQSPLSLDQQIEEPQEGQMNMDLLATAQQLAQYMLSLDENSRLMALMQLRQQSPDLYQVVLGLIQSGMSQAAPAEPQYEAPQAA
jgi:hypothetical protein